MKREAFIKLCKSFISQGGYLCETETFQKKWRTGGMQGGSCWGPQEIYPISADPEPEMEALDDFLEKYYPNISFLQYKKFSKHIKTSHRTQAEYYGNFYEYTMKSINFEDVYQVLVDIGFEKEQ